MMMTQRERVAAAKAKPKRARRIILAVYGLFFAFIVIYALSHPPTPAEIVADQQRLAIQAQQSTDRDATVNGLCDELKMCARYGNAAQHCAVAANFDNCMKVMLPSENVIASYDCQSEGSLRHPPGEVPSRMVCLLRGYFYWIRSGDH